MRPTARLRQKVELENLWLAVLSLLNKRPRHGRELRGLIKKKFDLLTGTVTAYKVLYSLEAGGYVTSKRRGRYVVYVITRKGRTELELGRRMLAGYARRLGW